jgi:hypothetical protein
MTLLLLAGKQRTYLHQTEHRHFPLGSILPEAACWNNKNIYWTRDTTTLNLLFVLQYYYFVAIAIVSSNLSTPNNLQ